MSPLPLVAGNGIASLFAAPFAWADPRSWPWIIYLWLALVVASSVHQMWKWYRRGTAKNWPTVAGRIDWTEARSKEGSLTSWKTRGGANYAAEIGYQYSVEGQSYSGDFHQDAGTDDEAREFIRDLDGKVVMVSYDPRKPSNSTLTEVSIADLRKLQSPASDQMVAAQRREVPAWMRPWLWPFMALSGIGLGVSLWVHLGALAGKRVAPEPFFWILHLGIFVVWFPAVLVATRRVGSTQRKDFWKAVLRGSPEWMRYMVYGFAGYAVVNFMIFFLQTPSGGATGSTPAVVWRGFSGHWMVFYSSALAIFYAAANTDESPLESPRRDQS